jgi:phosphoglycerate kinase
MTCASAPRCPPCEWLQEHGATVTACSHLGRPKGAPDPAFSMDPVRARLAELAPGVELLENLRFDAGETGNDEAFVAARRRPGPVRERRVRGIAPGARLDRRSAALAAVGRRSLLEREVEVLLGLRNEPRRPFIAILGGSKVSDKLGVIDALLEVADGLIIGGGMCFTFLAAMGHQVGSSLLEETRSTPASELLDSGATIHLPSDITGLGPGARSATRPPGERCASSDATCPMAGWASTSARARPRSSPT